MKRIILMLSVLISSWGLNFYWVDQGQAYAANVLEEFQNDADLLRLEHLVYWTGLIEEYYQKKGHYPLQNKLSDKADIILVRIATENQQRYFTKSFPQYNSALDQNASEYFSAFNTASLVQELEDGLGREIDEKYDIQKAATLSPIWYSYFIGKEGYVFWIPCITCGVTQISTLLMDGYTPTVNVVSEGMQDKVTKSLTRMDLMKHPIYKKWKNRTIYKEDYVRSLEKKNISHSKF
jgi:hypothetical protein